MTSGVAFSRPIRWFVSMLGETVIPFEYAGVVAGNVTRGLRPYDSPEIEIPSADKYFDVIRESGIVIDSEERKALIVEQVKQAADLVKGEAIIDEDLLTEVTHLVEMPTAVMGGFPEEYLEFPRDVLIWRDEETSEIFSRSTPPPLPQGEGSRATRDGVEGLIALLHRHPQRRRPAHRHRPRRQRTRAQRAFRRCRFLRPRRHQTSTRRLSPATEHAHLPDQTGLHAG